jgi:hypothetical protein
MKTVEEIKPNFAPFYSAGMYPELCKIFQQHGYALAVHGSMAKDFDLIAVPWVTRPKKPSTVIKAVKKRFAVDFPITSQRMKHGRVAYTMNVSFGECRLDLSFFPCV